MDNLSGYEEGLARSMVMHSKIYFGFKFIFSTDEEKMEMSIKLTFKAAKDSLKTHVRA